MWAIAYSLVVSEIHSNISSAKKRVNTLNAGSNVIGPGIRIGPLSNCFWWRTTQSAGRSKTGVQTVHFLISCFNFTLWLFAASCKLSAQSTHGNRVFFLYLNKVIFKTVCTHVEKFVKQFTKVKKTQCCRGRFSHNQHNSALQFDGCTKSNTNEVDWIGTLDLNIFFWKANQQGKV